MAERPQELTASEQQALDEINNILESQTRPMVSCFPVNKNDDSAPNGLFDSRVGGPFAWPKNKPLPFGRQEEEGQTSAASYYCLLQINLAQLPDEAKSPSTSLPATGILQVFVDTHDPGDNRYRAYGSAFPSIGNGDGFLVVVHKNEQEGNEKDDWKLHRQVGSTTDNNVAANTPIGPDGRFFDRGIPLRFEFHPRAPPNPSDYRLQKIYLDNMYANGQEVASLAFEAATDELLYPDEDPDYGIFWLLGHPDYTQEDIRTPERYGNYESLITIGSSQDVFMWGDCGIGTILVPQQELETFGDFPSALYTWDCA